MKTEKLLEATTEEMVELPPFHSAARQGNAEDLGQLLKIHPDLVDYGDGRGFTALMYAVLSKSLKCVDLLLKAGCQPDTKDNKGRTALLFCARKGWSEGCEAIINAGSDCQAVDESGRNAVHFSSCNDEDSCLEMILNHTSKEELNKQDVEGMTPLHWASFHNLDRNVLLLLDKGADPSVLDHESKSPLHWAAQNGCALACNALLSAPTSKLIINQKNDMGKTALHFAAAAGHLEIIFQLAQGFGCDIDLGDNEGRTALHWACAMGEHRCVAGLLRLGVPPHPVDEYGIPPVTYAKQLNYQACVSLFENYDPEKPETMLIPFQDRGLAAGIGEQEENADNPDTEVFSLILSNEKEKRQIENLNSLHGKICEKSYEMDKIKQALGRLIREEDLLNNSCNSNGLIIDSYGSRDTGSTESRSTFDFSVTDDVCVDASDDEQRYQSQMALSPTHFSSPDTRRRKKDSNAANLRKLSKPSYVPYALAPLKHKTTKVAKAGALWSPDEHPSSSLNSSFDADVSKGNKLLVGSDSVLSRQSSLDTAIHLTARNDVKRPTNSTEKPPGLRRKSISMNDGLDLLAVQKAQNAPLSRTHSFGTIQQSRRTLPVIQAKDGRNLTQRMTRAFYEIDEGYEAFDEKSLVSMKELNVDRKKSNTKKKHKRSRINLR